MLEVLLARCGSVVSRRELGSAAWPDGCPAPGRSTPGCAVSRPRRTARAADPQRASSRVDAGGRRRQPLINGEPSAAGCLARALEVEESVGELLDLGPPRLGFLHRARARASRSRPRGTPRAGRATRGCPTTITSPGSKPEPRADHARVRLGDLGAARRTPSRRSARRRSRGRRRRRPPRPARAAFGDARGRAEARRASRRPSSPTRRSSGGARPPSHTSSGCWIGLG